MRIDLLEILGQHGQISFKEFLEKLEHHIYIQETNAYNRGADEALDLAVRWSDITHEEILNIRKMM